VKYVVELARALAQHPAVYRVDLLTRLIKDPKVGPPTVFRPKTGTIARGALQACRGTEIAALKDVVELRSYFRYHILALLDLCTAQRPLN